MKLTMIPVWFLLMAALVAAGFWGISASAGNASAQTGAPAQVATLTAEPGDEPGTVVLAGSAASGATKYWIAGIKQTDWDANEFGNVIWEAAQTPTMHTLTSLESGAEYVFSITAGRGEGAATRWSPWAPLARGTPE